MTIMFKASENAETLKAPTLKELRRKGVVKWPVEEKSTINVEVYSGPPIEFPAKTIKVFLKEKDQ